MAFADCLPLLIPVVSLYLVSTGMLSDYVPGPMKKVLMLGLIYVLTYLAAKAKCWNTDKYVSLRAIAPVCIFIGWLLLHYFPLTSGIMFAFGDNIFVIILLSLIYKAIYDAPKVFGEC